MKDNVQKGIAPNTSMDIIFTIYTLQNWAAFVSWIHNIQRATASETFMNSIYNSLQTPELCCIVAQIQNEVGWFLVWYKSAIEDPNFM